MNVITTQEIVTLLIAIVCIGWVILRTVRTFGEVKNNNNPCSHCATGCSLQAEMRKKQQECKEKQEKRTRLFHLR